MTETKSSSLSSFLGEAAWERLAEELRLSRREVQTLPAVLEDQSVLAIASRLQMSRHTVHAHMERLRGKLSVRNRSQLILKVLTAFLLMTAEPDSPLPAICGDRASGRCPLNK